MTGRQKGFTLIELLIVLACLALLASLVAPSVTGSIQRAKESALREDLRVMRKAIDQYYADKKSYPPDLETLQREKYLRHIPLDPLNENNDGWLLLYDEKPGSPRGGVIDVKSKAPGNSADGVAYQEW